MMQFFSNYQKISETIKTTTPTVMDDEFSPNAFEAEGIYYKGKLIGMEDISVDCDEKICFDALNRLRTIARVRGEHKQKIQLNLNLDGVKVIDELTKIQLASHEVRRISYVVMDPQDFRSFGYIYNTSDGRHQFWAIKTERTANLVVLAFKDLFDEAYKRINNPETETNDQQDNQTISIPVPPNDSTVPIQQSLSSEFTPSFTPQLPLQSTQSATTLVSTTPDFDSVWGGSSSTTASQPLQIPQQELKFDNDAWNFSEPAARIKSPASRVESLRANNLFNLPPPPLSRRSTMPQQSVPTADAHNLFSAFPTVPPNTPVNSNISIQATQQTSSVSQQQQPNFLDPNPVSSTTLTPSTSPFGEFDFGGGDFSSKSTDIKPTDELFFP